MNASPISRRASSARAVRRHRRGDDRDAVAAQSSRPRRSAARSRRGPRARSRAPSTVFAHLVAVEHLDLRRRPVAQPLGERARGHGRLSRARQAGEPEREATPRASARQRPGETVIDVRCVVFDMVFLITVAWRSHVAVAAQRLEPAAVVLVLRPARALGDVRGTSRPQLDDDLRHVRRVRLHRLRARPAAERAIALCRCPGRSTAARSGFRSRSMYSQMFELRPVEQRMDAHVRARRELGLVLVPELRRLIGDVPVVLRRCAARSSAPSSGCPLRRRARRRSRR